MGKMTSKSKINTFGDPTKTFEVPFSCEEKYRIRYIDEVPSPYTSPQLQLGLDFHKFAEVFYDAVKIENKELQILPYLQELQNAARPELKFLMDNFITMEQGRLWTINKRYPDNPEDYFFPIFREKTLECQTLQIHGIVDYIGLNIDGLPMIVDYKTGTPKPGPALEEELMFYKVLVDESGILNEPIAHLQARFPQTMEVFHVQPREEIRKHLFQRIEAMRRKIHKNKFDKNPKSCESCEYLGTHCDGAYELPK